MPEHPTDPMDCGPNPGATVIKSLDTLQMTKGRKQSRVTLQMNRHEEFQIDQSTHRLNYLEYIGQRGISLSGSYQQGYSTAYNTQSHIKVVCNGYILTHILN